MNKKGGETDMSDKVTTDLGEANAVMFTNYKRTDGFEVSFTLRNGSGKDLMGKFDKAIEEIKLAGGTPLSFKSGGGFPAKPAAPTKPCEFHQGQMLKQKILQDGKELWSHSRGVYPNLQYCNGIGFPDERGQVREPYNGGEY